MTTTTLYAILLNTSYSTYFLTISFSLVIISTLFLLFFFNRYKKRVAIRKILSLEKQLIIYSTENNNYKNKLDELVEEKSTDLYHKVIHQEGIIAKKTIELNREKKKNYFRNIFLANMNHEVRTSLSSIIGLSSLLKSEMSLLKKHDLYDYSIGIGKSSHKLLEILENLIDISRIDANEYLVNKKSSNISIPIKQAIEKFQKKIERKKLTLDFNYQHLPDSIFDSDIVQKIAVIILDNAIKYSNEGLITIKIELNDSNNTINIIFSDTGFGIASNLLDEIYNPFQENSFGNSKIQHGNGLGLPLAKKLCRLIDSSIKIKSVITKGTTVSLSMPFEKTVEEVNIISPSNNKTPKVLHLKRTPKILIVEDDKMNRLVFKKMLEKISDVTFSIDGDTALAEMADNIKSDQIYDVILMDINLPEPWDGTKVMKEIKNRHPKAINIPFIAQTAYAMAEDKEKLLNDGFDDYISKPIDKQELYHIIESNIKSFQ